jgi:spore germination cell wall hydrolase CwlJ-like protein
MNRLIRDAGFAALVLTCAVSASPPEADSGTIKPIQLSASVAAESPISTQLAHTLEALAVEEAATPALAVSPDLVTSDAVVDGTDDDAPVRPNRSLAELVSDYASSDTADAEQECLATAIYYEAKSEPLAGQLTVAEVIINRTKSGRFPATLCGVVKQRGQFAFVRGGRLPATPRASAGWRTAVAISHIAREELASGSAPRALFFHAKRVSPGWRLTRVASIGNHVFYR